MDEKPELEKSTRWKVNNANVKLNSSIKEAIEVFYRETGLVVSSVRVDSQFSHHGEFIKPSLSIIIEI